MHWLWRLSEPPMLDTLTGSPNRTVPPGRCHRPAQGPDVRFVSRTPLGPWTTTSTVSRGTLANTSWYSASDRGAESPDHPSCACRSGWSVTRISEQPCTWTMNHLARTRMLNAGVQHVDGHACHTGWRAPSSSTSDWMVIR